MRLQAFAGDWQIERDDRGRAAPAAPAASPARARFDPVAGGPRLPRGGHAGARRRAADGGDAALPLARRRGGDDRGAVRRRPLLPPLRRRGARRRPPRTPARPTPTACATTSRAGRAGGRSGASPARARTTAWSAASARWRRGMARARSSPRAPRRLRPAARPRRRAPTGCCGDARLPRRPGGSGLHARSSPRAASSSSRTTTRTKPYAWLLVPSTEVTGIEDPAVFEAPVAGLLAIRLGRSGASSCPRRPRGSASRSTRRPGGSQNLLHIHISCVAAGGARRARGRADRPGLGGRALHRRRRPRLQRPQGRPRSSRARSCCCASCPAPPRTWAASRWR